MVMILKIRTSDIKKQFRTLRNGEVYLYLSPPTPVTEIIRIMGVHY